MTDRFNGFVVVLKHDLREDDAEATIAAIRQIKGVLSVEPHVGSLLEDHIAYQRVKDAISRKLWAALND